MMMVRVLKAPWRVTAIGALLLTLLLVAACGGGDVSDGGEAPPNEGQSASGEDSVANVDGEGGAEPGAPSISERKITLNATVRLRVDDVPKAVQEVEDIAAGAGGFVSSSDVAFNTADEDEQAASMKIRVPSETYTSVIRQLRGIATEVESESSQATEVTDEYTDLQARLRNLGATEARYLELLNRAQTVEEILAVQDRVNATRLEIEQVQGRLNVLNDLTDLATITIALSLPLPAARADQGSWAEEAVESSWETTKDALQVLGTVAIASGFLLAWLLIPALVFLGAWRLFGRRIWAAVDRIARM